MSVLIARIRKNRAEELRVSIDRWRGVDLVNLRIRFLAPDGSMRPGRQGVALRLELWTRCAPPSTGPTWSTLPTSKRKEEHDGRS